MTQLAASLELEVPTASVDPGSRVTITARLSVTGSAAGAAVLRVAFPPRDLAELAAQTEAPTNDATGVIANAQAPGDGLFVMASARKGAPGDSLTFAFSATVVGPPGAAVTVTVDVPDVVTIDGVPLPACRANASFAISWRAPEILTMELPTAHVDDPFHAVLESAGGQPPVLWSATGLPAWMQLSTTGVLSGTPRTEGTSTVRFVATASGVDAASASVSLLVEVGSARTGSAPPDSYLAEVCRLPLDAVGVAVGRDLVLREYRLALRCELASTWIGRLGSMMRAFGDAIRTWTFRSQASSWTRGHAPMLQASILVDGVEVAQATVRTSISVTAAFVDPYVSSSRGPAGLEEQNAALSAGWPLSGRFELSSALRLTPGRHELRVRWMLVGAFASGSAPLPKWTRQFSLSGWMGMLPSNPDHLPRFGNSAAVTFSTGLGANRAQIVAFPGTGADVVVGLADGSIQVIPERGDGGFAAPVVLAPAVSGGPALPIAVGQIDRIGRSSIVAGKGSGLVAYYNRVGGFAEHHLRVPRAQGTIISVDIRPATEQQGGCIAYGTAGSIGVLDDLESRVGDASEVNNTTSLVAPGGIVGDPTTAVRWLPERARTRGSRAGGWPIQRAASVDELAATLDVTGRMATFGRDLTGAWGLVRFVEPLAHVDLGLAPIGLAFVDFGDGVDMLAVGLRHTREVIAWRWVDGWTVTRRIRLPFRPGAVHRSPDRTTGVLVVPWNGGTATIVHSDGQTPPQLHAVHTSEGRMCVATGEDLVAIADRHTHQLVVFRAR